MKTRRDIIEDHARQRGVPEDALPAFVDRLDAFTRQWAIEEGDLAAFLAELEAVSVPVRDDGPSTTFVGPGDPSVPDSSAGAVTLDTGAFFDGDETVDREPTTSLPGRSLSGEDECTEEIPRGEVSLGRYEDLGLLGVGGMGEVRRVRDHKLRRTMAMKIIHAEMMRSPRLVSRFIDEAQVQAQLQHPNIVPIYEIARLPDGRHYFTMKQIRGLEFSSKILGVHAASPADRWRPAEDGTSFRDLVRIHQQVCETVAYAHAQGVIHRDLKPENIMIGGFGEVQVVDWGLAKVLGRDEAEWDETEEGIATDRSSSDALQTRMGSVAGTPCYMAPEQAFGRTEEVGTATDIYTLGAILYEILSGLPPYRGASAEEVLEKVKHSRPPTLRHSTANSSVTGLDGSPGFVEASPLVASAKIPQSLAGICEAAMQREIGERLASAGALAEELKQWLEGAEKRDKALAEVEAARQLAEEARGQERKSAAEWREANALLERDGAESDAGWQLWAEARESEAESRKLWRRYVRKLQGALVHAPELEEAHQALAERRIAELVAASATGDRAGWETRTQQLSAHLQALPAAARSQLEAQRDAGLADLVAGQRLQRGALVGRHAQREAVAALAEEGARLLTLLGTAGVGKTRLALELAEDLRAGFSRTVFCDLTEATDALGIARRLSRSLDVRLRDTDPVGHLAEVLATEPTLLVLDNLEQITPVIGPLAAGWVKHSESLQILATSRLRLGVEPETVVPVQPLSLLEGVDLFVRRGQVADPRFEVVPAQRQQVCALVEKLDSLPLALELAAARLNILSLDELSARLNERFSLLRSRGRDAQALDGALDWSWGLLKPWAKAALSQASLFRGGFTLAAAEGVIEVGSDKKAPAMFDILGELVDNSLLRKDQADQGGVRYSLLESIRAYAHDKLGDPGEMGPELRGPQALRQAQERHAAHFSQLGDTAALQALDSFDSGERWVTLFRELDNLVQAIGHGTAQSAPLCCLAALKVLGMKGPVSLGVDIATQVLGMSGLGRREQMLLEIERSKCLRISGRMQEARAMVAGTTSLAPEEEPSAPETEAAPVEEVEPATDDAPESEPESLAEAEAHPDLLEAERLMALGHVEHQESRYGEARKCFEAALVIFRTQANRKGEGHALGTLGSVNRLQGQYDEAIAHYTQSIAIAREIGDKRGEGTNLGNVGIVYQAQGQYDEAIAHYTQSIAIAQEIGDKLGEGNNLGNLGDVLIKLDRLDEAETAFREAIAIGDDTFPAAAGAFRGSLSRLLAQQGQMEEAQTLLETGEPQVENYPEEHAKFLCKKGRVCHLAGDAERARAALVQAQGLVAELNVRDDSEVGQAVAALAALLGESDPDGGGGGPSGDGHRRHRQRRSQTKSGSWR